MIGCLHAAGSNELTAKEYKTISAEDILKDIRLRNDTILNNKIVNGSLDLSELDDTITGKISITDSVILGPVNLAGKTFQEKVDFSGTVFQDDVTLSDSQEPAVFEKIVYFRDANFSKDADFDEVQLNGGSDFYGAKFNGKTHFRMANFSYGTKFENAQFYGGVSFSEADFGGNGGNAIFIKSLFKKDALFDNSDFDGDAIFTDAQFDEKAYFRMADFGRLAKFEGAYFYKNADFRSANFWGEANFNYAYFAEDALFDGAKINEKLRLSGSKFNRIQLNWKDIEDQNKLEYDDEAYLRLVENYRSQGLFTDADECYYDYRVLRRSNLSLGQKVLDLPLMAFYGYGVKPLRPIFWSIAVILAFALWFCDSNNKDCPPKRALKFSAKVFLSGTKPFSTDLVEFSKLAKKYKDRAVLERFLGTLFFLLFLITLANTVIIK